MNTNLVEFKYLKKWCDKHLQNTNIRFNPQTVPVQTLLDEVLSRLELLEHGIIALYAQKESQEQKKTTKSNTKRRKKDE